MTLAPLWDDDTLIKAWFNGVSIETTAGQLQVHARWLHEQWRRLKDEGRLPEQDRVLEYDDLDGRPSVLDGPKVPQYDTHGRPVQKRMTAGKDPLLVRLIQVHKTPRYDIPERFVR
jgi:hypothetical protein